MEHKELMLWTDGGTRPINPGPSAIGIVIKDKYNNIVKKHHEHVGHMTSNEAEYTAMIRGLQLCKELGGTHVIATTDSLCLSSHLTASKSNDRSPNLARLKEFIKKEAEGLDMFHVKHKRRHFNAEADKEVNLAFMERKITEQEHHCSDY